MSNPAEKAAHFVTFIREEADQAENYIREKNWDNAEKRATEIESLAGELANYINDARTTGGAK
jgi:hypothetical protein